MIRLQISTGFDSQHKVCTVIKQFDHSPFRIGNFLECPFAVCGNKTFAYESVEEVLLDLLLGIQLYNLQYGESMLLNILVESEKSEEQSFEMAKSMISYAEKSGHKVFFEKKSVLNDEALEGDSYMDSGYEVKCLSFADYSKKKTNSTDKNAEYHEIHHGKKVLDFAHPVDAKIIRVLDSPVVNQVFSKIVNLSTDMNYGLMLSTGIRLDNQPSEVADILRNCASILHIAVPYTVVSSSVPGLNAITVGSDDENCIAVSSLMKALMNKDELAFVLGHECGHIALGHVLYHTVMSTVRNVAELIPLVGHSVYQLVAWPLMAWYRRSEISADRAGLLCCGDVDIACKTLLKLECGFMNADDLDVNEYISNTNRQLKHSLLGKYQELLHEHPILAKRMEALQLFARSEKYFQLSGKKVPEGVIPISDKELENRTEQIIPVMD